MKDQKWITFCWHSYVGRGSDINIGILGHNGCQYCDYRLMLLHNPLIIPHGKTKIFNTPIILSSTMGQWGYCYRLFPKWQPILPLWKDVTFQPSDCQKDRTNNDWCFVDTHLTDTLTVIWCSIFYAKITIVVLDSQYNCSLNNCLHLKAWRHLNFWFTTIHYIWPINDGGQSDSSTFGWQFTVFWYICYFLMWTAQHYHLCMFRTLFSISITYHTWYSNSGPCVPAPSGELCDWMYGLMQYDGYYSFWIALCIDSSCYPSYEITDLNFVSKFHHYFSCCFPTET
jgi:hypothetical protein